MPLFGGGTSLLELPLPLYLLVMSPSVFLQSLLVQSLLLLACILLLSYVLNHMEHDDCGVSSKYSKLTIASNAACYIMSWIVGLALYAVSRSCELPPNVYPSCLMGGKGSTCLPDMPE